MASSTMKLCLLQLPAQCKYQKRIGDNCLCSFASEWRGYSSELAFWCVYRKCIDIVGKDLLLTPTTPASPAAPADDANHRESPSVEDRTETAPEP